LLHSYNEKSGQNSDPEVALIPRLDAKEVAAVFTARFHNFLKASDENYEDDLEGQHPADWYRGSWTTWHESDWRSTTYPSPFLCLSASLVFLRCVFCTELMRGSAVHHFYVPPSEKSVTKPKPRTSSQIQKAAISELEERERSGELTRYKVFGMTARILVDAARLAYNEEPEFEHNSHFGDEEMIAKLQNIGRLGALKRPDDELTRETMQKAAKLS
jgi:hypothetical protein